MTEPPQSSSHASVHGIMITSMHNKSHHNSAHCDVSLQTLNQPAEFASMETDVLKSKLSPLLGNCDEVEMVLREKNDRKDYGQISAFASKLGLYSCLYTKVVVVSKVPLPNYRFDLDDKRPQREVIMPPGVFRRVDTHLRDYFSMRPMNKEDCDDNMLSKLTTNGIIADEDGLFEQSEPMTNNKTTFGKFIMQRSLQMRDEQKAWQESPEGLKMLKFRTSLPAHKEKEAILTAISQDQVVIISGQTGCGKTTQIPQFILESEIKSTRGAVCRIMCTQPRRISAISVSERVSAERGERLGETVGYKVRLEGMKGKDTHLLFCTTGILLRRLSVDKNLKGVTHIIVDEIHERGMNEDLLPRRPELRLILMSATLDAELFSSYFNGAPVVHIPGFTYPVKTHFLEDILEMSGYRLTPDNQIDDYGPDKTWKMNKQAPGKRKSRLALAVEGNMNAADFKKYSLKTQESLSCWNSDCIGFNLIEYVLSHICEEEESTGGAVLVFMTGWEDIVSLLNKLKIHPLLGDTSRVLILTCHGSMSSSDQKLIFDKVEGVRKIILATNIAETSITIDDVVFVIDCGKAKESSYDALNNTPCLLPSWISKVSAIQRRGRAGRVQAGECYRLYPKCVYDGFADYQLPEILRTLLQSLCLQIKNLKLGGISEFLSKALQSPELLAVQNAIEYLKVIGALDQNENLTVLGYYLTMLPMEPKLGKMLILGAILNCVDPILTVAAGLCVRDPFLSPLDKKEQAKAAKAQFSHDYSDHLAVVRAYEGWKVAENDLIGNEYCWSNYISAQSMKAIDSLRTEFRSFLTDIALVDPNPAISNSWSYDEYLLRAVICYGLYPGICSVVHKEKSSLLKTMEDGKVHLYSNSANAQNSRIPYPWLAFSEKIKVNSVFLRDSTAISDSILLLFGGSISNGNKDGSLKMMEGYLEFFMEPTIAKMFQTIRRELDNLIHIKLMNPKIEIWSHHELISAIRLLISEKECKGRFVTNQQPPPVIIAGLSSTTGGENSKGELQTVLTRAGNKPPVYKTIQQIDGMFISSITLEGTEITGRPCNNKKQAEKDAASEALEFLRGSSIMLKKTKKES